MSHGEKLLTLEVECSNTIKTIKENIQKQLMIPVAEQVVILEGNVLQNDYTLSDCHIKCSKLYVMLKIGKNISIHVFLFKCSYNFT